MVDEIQVTDELEVEEGRLLLDLEAAVVEAGDRVAGLDIQPIRGKSKAAEPAPEDKPPEASPYLYTNNRGR